MGKGFSSPTHRRNSVSSFSLVSSKSSILAFKLFSSDFEFLLASAWAELFIRIARNSSALRYSPWVWKKCEMTATEDNVGREGGNWLTCSSRSAVMSQSSSSLCRLDTSSTEVFVAATLATFSCSRRTSEREDLEAPSGTKSRSALLANASGCTSLDASSKGNRRGVFRPLSGKSSRMSRIASLENCSRQNGQTGERRGGVFSTMVEQQWAQKMWPREGK